MYVKAGKRVRVPTVERCIRERIAKWNKNQKKKIVMNDWEITSAAECLVGLNSALLDEAEVFALIEKAPRNLDSGNHYYSVLFVNKKRRIERVWLFDFTRAVYGVEWNRDYSLPKWMFASGAIGMSRCLDATDGLFNFLSRDCGGCYAQINPK